MLSARRVGTALLLGMNGVSRIPSLDRVQFSLASTNKLLAHNNKHHQKVLPILRVDLNKKGRVILTGGSSGLRIGECRKYQDFQLYGWCSEKR